MGYLHRDTCHATLADAVQASCAAYPVSSVAASASAPQNLRVECQAVTATTYTLRPYVDDVAGTAVVLTPTFAACNENEKFEDLMELWGLGLAALVVVYLAKQFFIRTIIGNH